MNTKKNKSQKTISYYTNQEINHQQEANQKINKKPKVRKIKTNKQILVHVFYALGFFILLISITKLPYTGAIFDYVVEYFFGWAKFFVYAILLIFFITFYIPKAKKKIFSLHLVLTYITITIISSILLGSVGNGLFLINKQNTKEIENTLFANYLLQKSATASFSDVWAAAFKKAIGNEKYYFTLPMSYGGVAGYIHVDLYKNSGWVYSIVLTSLLLTFIIVFLISSKAKTRPIFNLKLKFINWLIRNLNKTHSQNYSLSKTKQINIDETKEELERQADNELKNEEIITSNKDISSSQMLEPNYSSTKQNQISQELIPKEQLLKKEDNKIRDNITNNQKIENNFKSQSTDSMLDLNDVNNQKNDYNDLNSSFEPKNFQATTNFDFVDDVTNITNNSELDLDNYKYYPKTIIINELNKDFYHELKVLAKDVDQDTQQFFIDQNISYEHSSINILFSSFEISYEIKEIHISAFLTKYSEQLKQHLLYYTLNQHLDNKLNVFSMGSKLYIQVALKNLSSTVSLKSLLDTIQYDNQLYIGVGKQSNREFMYLNNEYNIIMAHGNNGSGRSKLLSVAIISALYKKSPKELDLYLITNNTKSLSAIEQVPHIKAVAKADDFEATISLLRSLNEKTNEIIKRKLEPNNCSDIYQYNEKYQHDQIAQSLIVIAEYSEILESAYEQTFKTLIYRLRANAHSMGFKVLLFSAVTNEKTIEFKQISDCLIGLKNNNVNESYLFLNSTLCANLVGNGDMVIIKDRDFKNPIRAQVPQVENETYTTIINEIIQCDYNLDELRNEHKKTIKTKKFFSNLLN